MAYGESQQRQLAKSVSACNQSGQWRNVEKLSQPMAASARLNKRIES
jgi:hypothetical protein